MNNTNVNICEFTYWTGRTGEICVFPWKFRLKLWENSHQETKLK